MKPTRIMNVGYLFVLMLTATSCVVLSNPISDPFQAEADTALLGSWSGGPEGCWADCLHIGHYRPLGGTPERFPVGLMRIVRVNFSQQGDLVDTSDAQLLCFPTRIADTRYLNVAIVSRENEQTLLHSGWNEDCLFYAVFKYRIEGDKLFLQVMDLRGKQEAERSSAIRGFAKGLGRFVTLADTQNLVALLASEKGNAYFRNEVVFTRMKDQGQPLAAAQPGHAR